jgi:parallel beta-helix repeat protein
MSAMRLSFAACLAAVLSFAAAAGPLNPPAGPIAPTPGPEPRTPISGVNTPGDADSTFKITQPGSYYLTGNVTAAPGKHGIEIASDNVTLDLMGFTIAGNGGAGTIDGVHAELPALAQRSTIVNGVIRDFPGDGIGCEQFGAMLVDRVKVVSCLGNGIAVNSGSVVTNCICGGCGNVGFGTSNGVTLINCVAGECGSHGFQVGTSSIIKGCISSGNTGAGFATGSTTGLNISDSTADTNHGAGIAGPNQSLVINCQVHGNGDTTSAGGIVVGSSSMIADCLSSANTGPGILVGASGTVRGCTSQFNSTFGISGGGGTSVTDCNCAHNTTDGVSIASDAVVINTSAITNSGRGIIVSSQSLVRGCNATGNGNNGIEFIAFAGVVEGCTTVGNGANGIRVLQDTVVTGNISDQHSSGAGISVSSSDCRIQNNNCTDSSVGIQVDAGGSFIVGNTCSGNTSNYEIAAGNIVGNIVVGPLSLAISGSAGGAGTGSTNPWANFSY